MFVEKAAALGSCFRQLLWKHISGAWRIRCHVLYAVRVEVYYSFKLAPLFFFFFKRWCYSLYTTSENGEGRNQRVSIDLFVSLVQWSSFFAVNCPLVLLTAIFWVAFVQFRAYWTSGSKSCHSERWNRRDCCAQWPFPRSGLHGQFTLRFQYSTSCTLIKILTRGVTSVLWSHKVTFLLSMCVVLPFKAYLFKYDSTHGCFKGTVETKDGKLVINGHSIAVYFL